MKLKFFFFNVPYYGHINLSLELARRLNNEHRVVYYNISEFNNNNYKQYIQNEGLEFVALVPKERPVDDYWILMHLNFLKIARDFLDENLASIAEEPPDCIVADFFCITGIYLAHILNVPLVITQPMLFNAETIHNYIIEKDTLEIDRKRLKEYARISGELHKTYGTPFFNHPTDFILHHHIQKQPKNYLNLITTSRYFQTEPENFGKHCHFVGPMEVGDRQSIIDDFPFSELDGRPLLFISLGTVFSDNQEFLENCFEAFGDLNVQVVYTTGTFNLELKNKRKNFIVAGFVPQIEILKRATLFITHGGINSVNEAILYEIPSILCPQCADQFVNARRMEEIGAGYYIRSLLPTAKILKTVVEDILFSPGKIDRMKINTKEIKTSFQLSGGVEAAVNIIEPWIQSKN